MAFASLEGLPDVRSDFGYGQVCATLANIHRKEGQPAFLASDFMPFLQGSSAEGPRSEPLPDPQTQSRLIAALLGRKE